jgi:hypothetical protein
MPRQRVGDELTIGLLLYSIPSYEYAAHSRLRLAEVGNCVHVAHRTCIMYTLTLYIPTKFSTGYLSVLCTQVLLPGHLPNLVLLPGTCYYW